MSWSCQATRPNLEVVDVAAALGWFERLGFTSIAPMGEDFAIVDRGGFGFALVGTAQPAVLSVPAAYVEVDDVAAVLADAEAAGWDITNPLTDQPWGLRDFVARGPEGHQLAFGQRTSA